MTDERGDNVWGTRPAGQPAQHWRSRGAAPPSPTSPVDHSGYGAEAGHSDQRWVSPTSGRPPPGEGDLGEAQGPRSVGPLAAVMAATAGLTVLLVLLMGSIAPADHGTPTTEPCETTTVDPRSLLPVPTTDPAAGACTIIVPEAEPRDDD
jgi:hypothetical protein